MKTCSWSVLLVAVVLAGCKRPVKILNPPSQQDLSEKRVVFWDLDHTLYKQKTGVYSDQVVIRFVSKHLGISKKEAKRICSKYTVKYAGQVIKGLTVDFGVDPVEFEAWIDKEAKYDVVLQPDYKFIRKLISINARNWVFTNSGLGHAHRLLKTLGLIDYFEAIIYLNYSCKSEELILKPDQQAFLMAMKYAGVSDPSMCYLVDDIEANSQGACEVGWHSVHYCEPLFCPREGSRLFRRSDTEQCEHIPKVASIYDIDIVFPELIN